MSAWIGLHQEVVGRKVVSRAENSPERRQPLSALQRVRTGRKQSPPQKSPAFAVPNAVQTRGSIPLAIDCTCPSPSRRFTDPGWYDRGGKRPNPPSIAPTVMEPQDGRGSLGEPEWL